ncbi:hypothetical protein ASPZODRAFT_165133 [Penicilliopsis zonata CBS 506.65]|uniref:AMP-dependent synthetase/ligase domain-containing protein n=1 Tax=Penicilliopsis zonata CBS 506.65 TaxID=1073090 RepID=A0A1L9SM04_9EURO|nr:hypothetical protein ASPZODRAFT_165133 [Penicilliopsis zonata CBS 506.65]OJJ48220.1 hypothetical protein ASPZODRAFT_165133 [Penicilliopsis zonata CBS 506.65]
MVFTPPEWVAKLPPIPDHIPIADFVLDERYGRAPLGYSRDPFTCGLTGKTYSALDVVERVDFLSRALANEFDWAPNRGTEWDKVIGVFSLNTIDTLPLAWAVHRLGGLVSPANAAYSVAELTYQLRDAKATSLFTCLPLLKTALEAAAQAGIPRRRVYLLRLPPQIAGDAQPAEFTTVAQLVDRGRSLPRVEKLQWAAGEGSRRTAFLCYSSGTSGLPKGVMISHRNVIANTLQITAFEKDYRDSLRPPGVQSDVTEIALGLLPQSHIYALVVMCHAGPYRGDQVIVLPKFEIESFLAAVQDYRISSLFVVPPIIIAMLRNKKLLEKYNLSSVRSLFSGAAPLGEETARELQEFNPSMIIRQGYGLTETATVVTSTHPTDVLFGSSGVLLPGVEARLVDPEGNEITTLDTPGELIVRSPSVTLGYLHNEKATRETFDKDWMRTGDEIAIRLSPSGNQHVFVVDRIKELIKVKSSSNVLQGHQVAPAELEAHLLTHPFVADCAVIAIPDESAGEVPKAIVSKSSAAGDDDAATIRAIQKHVEDHKARHKWLKGGVRFIDAVPKSPSGKILRRLLRDQEKEARRKAGAKI